MKRIDTQFAVAGQFVPGNPQTGQKATRIGADWLNMMQEEVANAIELSGIVLNGNEQDQLYQAILAIAAGAAGAGGGSVPTTRTITGTGLITGGGDLVANRVFDVAKASAAEVTAGIVDTKAITPLGLATALSASLGSNAIVLPGGLIMQWGTNVGSYAEGAAFQMLPVAMTTNGYALAITPINQGASTSVDYFGQRVSKATGSFTGYLAKSGGAANCDGFEWFVIGR